MQDYHPPEQRNTDWQHCKRKYSVYHFLFGDKNWSTTIYTINYLPPKNTKKSVFFFQKIHIYFHLPSTKEPVTLSIKIGNVAICIPEINLHFNISGLETGRCRYVPLWHAYIHMFVTLSLWWSWSCLFLFIICSATWVIKIGNEEFEAPSRLRLKWPGNRPPLSHRHTVLNMLLHGHTFPKPRRYQNIKDLEETISRTF